MKIVLAVFILIFIRKTIVTELYPIILFNNTNLQNNICYMTNIENRDNQWCELITSKINLSMMKTCITYNESLPNLDDQTMISEWIDRSIAATNCSTFLLTSMTTSQKHILTIVESIVLYMTDYQLKHEDHEALGSFTKFFLVKAAQIIVQSRLGEKKTTKSKQVHSGNEWFYLSIKDIPEVTVHAKKCLEDAQHLLIDHPHRPFCVEISLHTPDSDTIALETWCISFDDSISDPLQRVRFNVYNRMSIVLRSLLACTRATPTYQLSRKQSADKYIICYKMYCGEPIVSHLGEHYSKKTIGNIVTPIGRFVLNVAYRVCLTVSSQQNDNSATTQFPMDFKDDYFSPNIIRHSTEEKGSNAHIPSDHNYNVAKSSAIEISKRRHTSCDSISSNHGTPDKTYYSNIRAAFAPPCTTTHPTHVGSYNCSNDKDLPFTTMMEQENSNNHHQQHHSMEQDHSKEENSKKNLLIEDDAEKEQVPDDFIFVEVKPFFGKSDSTDDLALFIRSCQQPLKLEAFVVEPSLDETITQLNEELRVFESKVEEFDQLVNTLNMERQI